MRCQATAYFYLFKCDAKTWRYCISLPGFLPKEEREIISVYEKRGKLMKGRRQKEDMALSRRF